MNNLSFNEDQLGALNNRISSSSSIVGGTHGPPGTGKTVVAANESVLAANSLHDRVLVCSFQNSTVDHMGPVVYGPYLTRLLAPLDD